jgi:hypothetical protein
METKIVNTTFDISEFEEEETWLTAMHRQGWKLVQISKNKYVLEECQAEDWIYRLDFQKKDVNRESYIRFFTDYGWEFVLQQNDWFYFRKKNDGDAADVSIFSDNESKIEMCERVLSGKIKANVALFLISCVIVAFTLFTTTFSDADVVLIPLFPAVNDFVKAALPWIGMGLLVATSYSFSSYNKMKKKIIRMKNPLERI